MYSSYENRNHNHYDHHNDPAIEEQQSDHIAQKRVMACNENHRKHKRVIAFWRLCKHLQQDLEGSIDVRENAPVHSQDAIRISGSNQVIRKRTAYIRVLLASSDHALTATRCQSAALSEVGSERDEWND